MSKPRRRRRKSARLPVRRLGTSDREALNQSRANGPSISVGGPFCRVLKIWGVFAYMCRRSVPMLTPDGNGSRPTTHVGNQ
jgi:hypothetical protein